VRVVEESLQQDGVLSIVQPDFVIAP